MIWRKGEGVEKESSERFIEGNRPGGGGSRREAKISARRRRSLMEKKVVGFKSNRV